MTSTLKLYKDCKVLPERNFKVDDFETYLNSLTKTTLASFQFVKHNLALKIKITKDQVNLEFLSQYNINYCSIINNASSSSFPTNVVYYFIVGKEWRSESVIELTLMMDTINTFVGTEGLELSDKTKIVREHKDRYSIVDNNYMRPIIDFYSEGLHPVLYKKSSTELYQNTGTSSVHNKFYLVYKNRSDSENSAVDCFIFPEGAMTFPTNSDYYNGIKTASDVASLFSYGNHLFILQSENHYTSQGTTTDVAIRLNSSQYSGFITIPTGSLIMFSKTSDGEFALKLYEWQEASGSVSAGWISIEGLEFILQPNETIQFVNLFMIRNMPNAFDPHETAEDLGTYAQQTTGFPKYSSYTLSPFNLVNRTESTLIRIIEIPYFPILLYEDQYGRITTQWDKVERVEYGAVGSGINTFRLKDTEVFENFIRIGITNPFAPLQNILRPRRLNIQKDIGYETKLYHSDYYLPKFIYDSFAFGFQLEKVANQISSFKFYFKMTTTMNSRFVFHFNEYNIIGKSEEDYDNICPVARNNEVPIYNSAYLNYLRTGFNYDVKSKERANENTLASVGNSIVGVITTLAGITTGNPVLTALGITSTISAFTTSVITSANTIAQNEQNIQAKITQYKAQANSVSGSDDIDLLNYYTNGNKAKLCIYSVSTKMQNALFDVFYYTGYVADYFGVPNTHTRTYFNFVCAEVVFAQTPNLPIEIIEDIRNKYKEGITFLHKYNSSWDFEQTMENWELSLTNSVRIHEETITSSNFQANREYVIKKEVNASVIARLQKNGHLTWRKRDMSTLEVLEEIEELGAVNIKGNITPKAMDVRSGSTISKEITLRQYLLTSYYWTIEFDNSSVSGYNANIFYSNLLGYIEEV